MKSLRMAATLAVLAAVYFAAAKFGLTLAFVHASATAVWPPTGISLAAILLLGYRVWPGIYLGAFLANLTTAGNALSSIGIAAGNTLEAMLGAYLVSRFAGGRYTFRRADHIFRFVLLAAVLATTASATVGVTSLSLTGFARWSDFGPIWLTWWLGDAAGALIVAPFLLLWWTEPRSQWTRARIAEALLLTGTVIAVAAVVFGGTFPFEYLTVPLLAWAAFRFGPRETASVIVLLAGIAVAGTTRGRGPFLAETQNASLLLVQAFMAIMAMVNLPVAALVDERKQAQQRLRESEQRFRELYEREYAVADVLQQSLLPPSLPEIPGLVVAARYLPAEPRPVGGDWYDVLALPGGQVGLVIGDVSGRGVEAAKVMGKVRSGVRAYAIEGHGPGGVLERVNRLVDEDEMLTLVYVILDLDTLTLRYSSAGHPPPVMLLPDGRTQFLDGSGLPLGTTLQFGYREEQAAIVPNSILVLYTDGLVEQKGIGLDRGLQRLASTVATGLGRSAHDVAQRITEIHRAAGAEDDAAFLVVQAGTLDPLRLVLRLPAVPSALPQLRHTLRRWFAPSGLSKEESFALTVSVGEACTNAIEHAYGLSDAFMDVEAVRADNVVTVVVRDRGAWRPERDHHRGHGVGRHPQSHGSRRGDADGRRDIDSVVPAAPADGSGMRALAKIHTQPSGDMVVASIDGEIDLTNASQIAQDLFDNVPHTADGIIIDLSRTAYLDSRGVQLLLELTRRLRMRRQTIRLVVPETSVLRRLLDILAVSNVMAIHPSVDEAMADPQ